VRRRRSDSSSWSRRSWRRCGHRYGTSRGRLDGARPRAAGRGRRPGGRAKGGCTAPAAGRDGVPLADPRGSQTSFRERARRVRGYTRTGNGIITHPRVISLFSKFRYGSGWVSPRAEVSSRAYTHVIVNPPIHRPRLSTRRQGFALRAGHVASALMPEGGSMLSKMTAAVTVASLCTSAWPPRRSGSLPRARRTGAGRRGRAREYGQRESNP
jgi:hypothetical protein